MVSARQETCQGCYVNVPPSCSLRFKKIMPSSVVRTAIGFSTGRETARRNDGSGSGSPERDTLNLHTDGASRGNPGEAGAGLWISDGEGRKVLK